MHARNLYRHPIDFSALADTYPALRDFLVNTSIDFKDAEAQRCLTRALMWRDFKIQLEIPANRLCPPVPNRLNYVLWIEDLILSHAWFDRPDRVVRGIDIGTGATAIYPLLACQKNPQWEMIGTELDADSFDVAQRNVHKNNLEKSIKILKATHEQPILFPLQNLPLGTESFFDFVMCNPPFYSNAKEIEDSLRKKRSVPNAHCTGSENEMIFSNGGEEGFVRQMIVESVNFGEKCRWYTSMLGKISSIQALHGCLVEHSITNYAISEFVQGQTRRWVIGWSFSDFRLPDAIGRISSSNSSIPPNILPPRSSLVQPIPTHSGDALKETLFGVLDALESVSYHQRTESLSTDFSLVVEASDISWTRNARRRKRKREEDDTTQKIATTSTTSIHPILVCIVSLLPSMSGPSAPFAQHSKEPCELHFQWARGADHSIFESFVSHVARKVGNPK